MSTPDTEEENRTLRDKVAHLTSTVEFLQSVIKHMEEQSIRERKSCMKTLQDELETLKEEKTEHETLIRQQSDYISALASKRNTTSHKCDCRCAATAPTVQGTVSTPAPGKDSSTTQEWPARLSSQIREICDDIDEIISYRLQQHE